MKKVLGLLLAGALVFGMVGCDGKDKGEDDLVSVEQTQSTESDTSDANGGDTTDGGSSEVTTDENIDGGKDSEPATDAGDNWTKPY